MVISNLINTNIPFLLVYCSTIMQGLLKVPKEIIFLYLFINIRNSLEYSILSRIYSLWLIERKEEYFTGSNNKTSLLILFADLLYKDVST